MQASVGGIKPNSSANLQEILAVANGCMNNQQYAAAKTLYKKACQIKLDLLEPWFKRAQIAQAQGKVSKTIKYCKEARNIDRYNLAVAQLLYEAQEKELAILQPQVSQCTIDRKSLATFNPEQSFELADKITRNPHFKKDYRVYTTQQKGDRFDNVFPNISTLLRVTSSEEDDYFHANAITIDDLRFISTQTPIPSSQEKFWTMINQQGCGVIINLANDKDFGDEQVYWMFGEEDTKIYGRIKVKLLLKEPLEGLVSYTFQVVDMQSNKTVITKMHQFTTWPDHGVPNHPNVLWQFVNTIRLYHLRQSNNGLMNAPIVAHCKAGYGRAGTFLLYYIALHRLLNGAQTLNFCELLIELRKQRFFLVSSKEQFAYAVRCIQHHLSLPPDHERQRLKSSA